MGMTRGEYSVFELPRLDASVVGHTLTVTVLPRAEDMDTQIFLRSFRTGMPYFTLVLLSGGGEWGEGTGHLSSVIHVGAG